MFVDAYASLYHNSCCSSQLQSPCLWFTSPRSGGFSLIPMIPIIGFTQHLQELLSFFRKKKKLSCLIHPNMGCTPNPSIFHWNGQGLGLFPIHPSAVFVKSSRLASRHSFSPCIMGPSVEKPNESCSAANFFLLSNGKLWKNKYLELNPT